MGAGDGTRLATGVKPGGVENPVMPWVVGSSDGACIDGPGETGRDVVRHVHCDNPGGVGVEL